MKHVKRLLAFCMAVIMMCGTTVGVAAEGVVFSASLLFLYGEYEYDESTHTFYIYDFYL
jgi:uncharacterized ion transporter superfamily protein YfcC